MAIGTTKGLFFVSDGAVDGPVLKGDAVSGFAQLSDRYLAAATSASSGAVVRASDDGGLTWAEPSAVELDGTEVQLGGQWHLHVDRRPNADGTIWAGAEPGALFSSEDSGDSFKLVRGLWEHADRPTWEKGDCGPAVNSIITNPERPDRLLVGISGAGVYRSEDGGSTWVAANHGLGETGCVHKLAADASSPDCLWAQTHSGIYRTEDAGEHWESAGHVGEPNGFPTDFGFAVVSHPDEAGTAWVFPLESAVFRCAPLGRCRVYRTMDRGHNWEGLSDGLPARNAYVTVLGDAFDIARDLPYPLVFGTRSGHVFASVDTGDSWRLATSYLPPILCVRVLD